MTRDERDADLRAILHQYDRGLAEGLVLLPRPQLLAVLEGVARCRDCLAALEAELAWLRQLSIGGLPLLRVDLDELGDLVREAWVQSCG